MVEVSSFKVEIKGIENKINREIEIKNTDTLADLVYFILSSFELYGNEFYSITIDKERYDSVNYIFDNDEYKSAMSIELKDLSLDKNKEIILEYDYNNKVIFNIKYLDSKKVDKDDYPKVISGSGKGALDFVSGEELKKIIEETDKNGVSSYSTTIIDGDEEIEEIFDYRDFDLNDNNMLSGFNTKMIKDDYEKVSLIDILRIMRKNQVRFYKSDIKSIVRPYDYLKEYIPDNYGDLSDEEIKKLNIPDYEDLNIYMLPTYEKINNKEIMTSYVKNNIEDKEIRKVLFYALRNYDYMDKFYNGLRLYGLFKDYLEYSFDYYYNILKKWKEKNNID